jgi:signal transduction histidine kinase/ligand-binding sensor domain-containing protein
VKKGLALLACFLFFHGLCKAQSFATLNYTISEGMPSNEVYNVAQDHNGFLWFGTDNGVIRYDGYELLRYGVDEGLTDPVVFGFYEDFRGRMWFRTFTGKLCYYENGRIFPYKFNDVLAKATSKSIISNIFLDSLDQLWFSTYRYRGVFGKIDNKGSLEEKFPGEAVIYCHEAGDNLLFGYRQEDIPAMEFNGKNFRFKSAGGCELFHVMATHWRGKLYISECRNLIEFDGKTLKTVYSSSNPIISMSVDRHDHLWVGYSTGGTERFSEPSFTSPISLDAVKKLSVTKVFQDNIEGIWVSTLEQGVFHIPNIGIVNHEVPGNDRIKLIASSKQSLYIGTAAGKVFKSTVENPFEFKGLFKTPLKGLFVDSEENTWLTSANESFCFDRDFKKHKTRKTHLSLTNVAESPSGRIYTAAGGIVMAAFDPDTDNYLFKHLPVMGRSVFILDTTLYIGTRSGLLTSDLNIEHIREVKSLADFKINRILRLNDSTLLLTTIGRGFMVFNTRTQHYINYNIASKFVANNIYATIINGESLWLGTENGLIKLDVQSLLRNNPLFHVLGRHNGLMSNQITNLAARGNNICVFSDLGFSVLKENISRQPEHYPKFYLKNLKVNSREVDPLALQLDLAFDENYIEVNFGFISLDKQKIFNRHRVNKSEPWNYTALKYLQYYSLAPGTYEIESQYSFDNINWHSGFTSPSIIINAPLWKRWYFQAFIALLVMVFIYIFYRYQIGLIRMHQQKLIQSEIQTVERERTRIAKDLHDSVGTDFSAIKMVVSQSLRKHNDPIAEEVETQFQHTIQEIKTIIYGLSPPGLERYGLMTGLKNYTEKINGKVPVEITINTFGKEVRDPALSISVFRIIQELISNTLKHANAKNISIHINAFDDLLSVVYEDNGKGFEWQGGSGAGLYNIESRIQSVNGQLRFESSDYGVSYTIDIPLK